MFRYRKNKTLEYSIKNVSTITCSLFQKKKNTKYFKIISLHGTLGLYVCSEQTLITMCQLYIFI